MGLVDPACAIIPPQKKYPRKEATKSDTVRIEELENRVERLQTLVAILQADRFIGFDPAMETK